MDDEVLKAPDVIGATTVGLGDILARAFLKTPNSPH